VSTFVLYGLLLKATVTSFAGMGSLPQIHHDFVESYHLLTEEELSQAVLVGRSTPGPIGAYVVAVGYVAGGWMGALVGWLAMVTPALAAIPILLVIERWLHLPRMRAAVDAVVVASAVLLAVSGASLAGEGYQQLMRAIALLR
jgi:chromate transporter